MKNKTYFLPRRFCQIAAVLSGTLTALSDGMQYGWSSPISVILLSSSSPIAINETDVVVLETIYMFGGMCGIPLTIYLLNKIGRKKTMLISASESLVAWIVLAALPSREFLFAARFVTGVAADVNFVTAPVYIAEISDKQIRGCLGSMVYIMMMTGIVLIYCIGPYVSITVSSIVGASVVALQLLTFSMMPESPYYYLIKNQKEDARKSLQFFRSENDVEFELNEIEESIKQENSDHSNALDLFKISSNLKAVIIMTVLNTAQHFSGISVMFMNMHMILEDAASLLEANQAAILFSAIMLASCTVAGFMMDKAGRKILLYTSSFLTGVSLLILACYFTVKNVGFDISSINWLPVFGVMLYALSYKFGLGLVPIVLTAEIFPSNVKVYGVTYADFVYVISSLLSLLIFHILQKSVGMEVPFYLFSLCCLLTCLFSIFYVPETKEKTLEEIQYLFKRSVFGKIDSVDNVKIRKDNQSLVLTNNSDAINYGTNNLIK